MTNLARALALTLCVAFINTTNAQSSAHSPSTTTISEARADFIQLNPRIKFHEFGNRLTRVYGVPFTHGNSPTQTAETFRTSHANIFGVAPENLLPLSSLHPHGNTQGVMYNPQTDTYKFTLIYYSQYHDGLPVFESDLRILVRNTADYPAVLAAANLRPLGDFRASPAALKAARSFLPESRYETELTSFSTPQTVIWAGVNDMIVEPQLAVTFVGDNYDDPFAPAPLRYLFVVDPLTANVLYQRNLIIFTDVTGNVSGLATEGAKADYCNPESSTGMPYAHVAIAGGNSTFADSAGNFMIPHGGTTSVSAYSYMWGQYFEVDNVQGNEEILSTTITPPGPADFLHNAANTDEFVRAQVNGYIQANFVRDWLLTYNPSYPTISTQTGFPVYVNRTDTYCPGNAWYDGSSLNFCSAGSGYPNTAWQSVIHHEYGHHAVGSGGSGQGQYGEGMSDCFSMLNVDDPILGYGFSGDCNTGLRTADNNYQYPCTGAIHDCGQLLSGCVWDTRNELILTEPTNYLEILSNLTVNSILLHSGELITPQITIDYLTLDDDNGDIYDGTPHFDEITTGFGAHNMWQGPPPENDPCDQAARACPGTYGGATSDMTNDGSATCGASSSTADVWYRYTPASSGTLNINLCNSDYDTVLSVHTGCPGSTSNELACNDNTSWFGECGWLPTDQSALSLSVAAGNTYYIRIAGSSGATGNYVLELAGPDCLPEQTGACCYTDGTCEVLTETECTTAGGNYQGNDTTCLPNPCLQPNGACCATDGTCAILSETDCITAGGDYQGDGTNCDPNPCPQPVTGACCHADYTCTTQTPGDCNAGGGIYLGDDTNCADTNSNGHGDQCECHGDSNCDGIVNFDDIDYFVAALVNPADWEALFPTGPACDYLHNDANWDGFVNFDDIDPFVNSLVSGSCIPMP